MTPPPRFDAPADRDPPNPPSPDRPGAADASHVPAPAKPDDAPAAADQGSDPSDSSPGLSTAHDSGGHASGDSAAGASAIGSVVGSGLPSGEASHDPAAGLPPAAASASASHAASGTTSEVPSAAPSGAAPENTPGGGRGRERSRFAGDELAIVLSHYDLGVIDKVKAYPRGSRKAPKLILRTHSGMYLLKRRASGKDDAYKVAFCHEIQLRLADQQFPLPHLIGTREENNSMLQLRGAIYEVFEYIKGSGYDASLEATADAGKTLALFHKLLRDFDPSYEPPTGSYHQASSVARAFKQLQPALQRCDPPRAAREARAIQDNTRFLARAYTDAAQGANDLGLGRWPRQVVHSDWHPGNMLFRGSRVVAVIDYDAARLLPRVIDTANGALQFAILGGGEDPGQWPDYLDESRFKRFVRGYDLVPEAVLSRAELRAIPPLMIEALIAESVIPIAATGGFARMPGIDFLRMVERKVRWLQDHADQLVQMLQQ